MVNYGNSCIYKIVCNDLNVTDCYVGSTTNFNRRKQNHKDACMNQNSKAYNYVVYSVIRQNGGWCNWTMIEIEKYPCNDKRELEKRKREWIEKLNATLNKQLPTRTQQDYMKEYRNQNNDQINAYKRYYYDQNKEKN